MRAVFEIRPPAWGETLAILQSVSLPDGPEEVRAHVVEVDGERATARSYVLVLRAAAAIGITVAGRYEDQLVKINGAWRFRERKVHFDMMARG